VTPAAQERRVWELLTKDFQWTVPRDHAIQIRDRRGGRVSSARLQIFELLVTTILATIRPEFAWSVTPNRPDDGVDFVGVHRFLDDSELGISAAITVGGQCKKRTRVDDVIGEIAGSLIRMADALNPTFFVVALSARLSQRRVERARGTLERQCQRHCHILDRAQIEGLMVEYLDLVADVVLNGLAPAERDEVLAYLETRRPPAPPPSVTSVAAPRALAGEPFRVAVEVRWPLASHPEARLWWRQPARPDRGTVTLIGPLAADGPGGAELAARTSAGDPLGAVFSLELVTYVVGRVDLGELRLGLHAQGPGSAEPHPLGVVDVVENMRPRFFERPYRAQLVRLSDAYARVLAGAVAPVGVVGAGGSGKSRMCEEFSLDKRRRGATVVAVKHLKTHEAPHRILADLLSGLIPGGTSLDGREADDVVLSLAHYDGALASRAAPAIRSLFETRGKPAHTKDQSLISALLVLIAARVREKEGPLIVHLQDLHWSSADVLSLLERVVRQLAQLLAGSAPQKRKSAGVLFLFEGRVRESDEASDDAWSSAPFEAFLQRSDGVTVTCSAFAPEDALAFTRLLFEDRHNAHRLVPDDLLELQHEVAERVHSAAGGNPFHTLEQVRLLRELGVVGQNPRTGLLYLVRAVPPAAALPDSIFASIRQRWQYMRGRAPDLALLVWGCALLEDRLPAPMFRALWVALAPNVSLRDIDTTDILWTGDGSNHEVVFRHENYFESIRRFTMSDTDRARVVDVYCRWFESLRRPGAADRFRWARAMFEHPTPDVPRARELLASALRSSRRSGDPRLTRRILAFSLDEAWRLDQQSPLSTAGFLARCDEELGLCRDLLGIDRSEAARRLERVRTRIEDRLQATATTLRPTTVDAMLRRQLTMEALNAQVLFNYRRPAQAAELAARVIAGARARRKHAPGDPDWESLEMEALYTEAVARALSGEYPLAVRSSAEAAAIGEHSTSRVARNVVSTYGSLLLSEDPKRGEAILRDCIAKWPDDSSSDAFLMQIHLSMALLLQAYPQKPGSAKRQSLLAEAADRMSHVHDSCRRLGLYSDAGAAALVRGMVAAVGGEGDEASWFAYGVAGAARGGQMETLWRSHLNLASALYRRAGVVTESAHDHAVAAMEIMQDSLSNYSEPERSPRFQMLRIGMAAVVWILIATSDETGFAILEQYPTLREHFSDPERGVLAPYDGGPRHYQWLRVDDVDYVLY
jgi:AAA ATPase-like protein